MVAMNDIEALSRRIAREFHPDKIIVLGSHAWGARQVCSDVDLRVIMPFTGHPFDKSMEILDRSDSDFFADVVARTPDDAARGYREYDPLVREAFNRGEVLYDRHR